MRMNGTSVVRQDTVYVIRTGDFTGRESKKDSRFSNVMMLGSKGLEYIKCSNCFLIIFIYTACRASILSEIKTMGSGMRDKRFCLMTISAQKIKGGSDTKSSDKKLFSPETIYATNFQGFLSNRCKHKSDHSIFKTCRRKEGYLLWNY